MVTLDHIESSFNKTANDVIGGNTDIESSYDLSPHSGPTLDHIALNVLTERVALSGTAREHGDLCRLLTPLVDHHETLLDMLGHPDRAIRNAVAIALGPQLPPQLEAKIVERALETPLRGDEAEVFCHALRHGKSPEAKRVLQTIALQSEPGFTSIAARIALQNQESAKANE